VLLRIRATGLDITPLIDDQYGRQSYLEVPNIDFDGRCPMNPARGKCASAGQRTVRIPRTRGHEARTARGRGHGAIIPSRAGGSLLLSIGSLMAARRCCNPGKFYRLKHVVNRRQFMSHAIDELERQAIEAYLAGADEASEDLWARAHAECLRGHHSVRAARCVFWIVLDLFNRGEWARGNGWLARGLRLLESTPEVAERGLLSVLVTRNHLKQGDVDAAGQAADHAVALSGRFDDPELAIFSRLGQSLVQARRGQFAEAAALFDEIMVAVTVDPVSPIAVGVVYCAVIDACRSLFDLSRAREWTTALGRWCSAQSNLVAFRGKCLVHRAEILRLTGAWSEAFAEAEQACTWSDAHANSFKYPAGSAFYELAEIHRLRGDFGAAEAAYHRASEHGQMPEPGLTLLQLAQGKPEFAETSIRRLLSEHQGSLMRAAVLHAAVEILTARDDAITARAAADELVNIARHYETPALRALAAHAAGAVSLAEGDLQMALGELRQAWMLWQELEAPYEAARVRVLLGRVCQQLGDQTAAELEFDTARRVFQRLSAVPDMARVDVMRVRTHKVGACSLTVRESQVIELIAKGQSNREIAQQLSISERTVDRHVSNILLKLDLSSRSAATAYAYQHGLL
jgi:DNA-binding CsgD family transcriptional regulator